MQLNSTEQLRMDNFGNLLTKSRVQSDEFDSMKNFYEEYVDDPKQLATFADECPVLEDFDDDLVSTLGPKQAAKVIELMETDCSSLDLREATLDPEFSSITSDWH